MHGKIVRLSESKLTSTSWREARYLVHGRLYNSLTVAGHQTRALSRVFGALKTVQLSIIALDQNPVYISQDGLIGGVTVLILCISPGGALYLYQAS